MNMQLAPDTEVIYGSSEMVEVPRALLPRIVADGLAYECPAHDDGPRYETVWDNEQGTEADRLDRIDKLVRLEELRAILRDESMSYGDYAELADLAQYIDPSDVELLEPAGVPEFADGDGVVLNDLTDGQVLAYNKRNDDPILTCDLCPKREWSGDLTPDWNGETGNHLSCEQKRVQSWSAASLASGYCDRCGRSIGPEHDGWCPQTDAEIEAVGDRVEAEQRAVAER